jgi:putative transposase
MKTDNVIALSGPAADARSVLEEIARAGAIKMLRAALELEAQEFVDRFADRLDDEGRRLVVRNGYLPERELASGIGPLPVKKPRVRDRSGKESFSSRILPSFMRRVPSVDALIPALYLKGVSTNDFSEALTAILGPNATGLSPSNIVRLKEGWKQDFENWEKRDLTGKRYVYVWADGIYFNVRLDKDRPCILVLMGATKEGKKELIAVWDGHRESKVSWQTVLRDLKRRGLTIGPELAIGDGALGFWAALAEEFPEARQQRCWVHKTANILDRLPKSVQTDAKKLIHEMYLAPTKEAAMEGYRDFVTRFHAKYPKAVECLQKDTDVLFTFYDFPAEHWKHIRTTNPIESTFATLRHRTKRTKGCGSRAATLTMVFKLALEAEKNWRRLNGHELVAKIIEGVRFRNGEVVTEAAASAAA